MHQFPVNPTVRAQWVKFVQRHRVDFGEPVAKHASLCSAHFEQSCYEGSLAFSLDGMTQIKRNKVLIKGSVPTRHAVLPEGPEVLTDRKRRQLEAKKKKVDEAREESMSNLVDDHDDDTNEENPCNIVTDVCMSPIDESSSNTNASTATASVTTPFTSPVALTSTNNTCATPVNTTLVSFTTPSPNVTPLQGSSCVDCVYKSKFKNQTKQTMRLRRIVKEQKKEIRELKSEVIETASEGEIDMQEESGSKDFFLWSSTGTDTDMATENEDGDWRVDSDTPEYDEPKFIVFYSMVLHIFTLFCFKCKESSPTATMKQDGTIVTVTQSCSKCHDNYIWKSQPTVLGKYPAGNILLSFAVLMAGASINKLLLVFRHIGLHVFSARTYFRHQKSFLVPVVLHHWETYQANLISKIRKLKNVAWTGDGRFD
ncbi:THAP domain-containing protein 2 [Stylophora pistillata]|uniref:THAP domain-containing protein 2 n=1 Tax=Stylophora pistillata TaxID=50429 RepID=A0A2B4QZW7_STYPI|nr:THAP domain-containing protein 2 [Stylophora pistillata]